MVLCWAPLPGHIVEIREKNPESEFCRTPLGQSFTEGRFLVFFFTSSRHVALFSLGLYIQAESCLKFFGSREPIEP